MSEKWATIQLQDAELARLRERVTILEHHKEEIRIERDETLGLVGRLQDELERWKESHRVAVVAYENMKAKRGKASSKNFRQGEEIKRLRAELDEVGATVAEGEGRRACS